MPFRACTCKSSAGVKHWPVAWERSDQTLTSPLKRMLGREGKKERAIVQTARGYMSSIPFLSVPFATLTHTFRALLRNGNECLRTGFYALVSGCPTGVSNKSVTRACLWGDSNSQFLLSQLSKRDCLNRIMVKVWRGIIFALFQLE